MKQVNNFIVLVFLLLCISGFSQEIDTTIEDNPVSKGTIFLSGQSSFRAGLSGLDNPFFNYSSYSISPTIGYFLIDNLVVGAGVNFSGFKATGSSPSEFPSESESKGRGISFAPFVRYYFNTGRIKPYVGGSVGFGSNKARNESTIIINGVSNFAENERKQRSTEYTATGGVAIFLTKYISVDTGVQYNNSTFNRDLNNGDESESTSSRINLTGGISVYL
jgi:outer membrane protein